MNRKSVSETKVHQMQNVSAMFDEEKITRCVLFYLLVAPSFQVCSYRVRIPLTPPLQHPLLHSDTPGLQTQLTVEKKTRT